MVQQLSKQSTQLKGDDDDRISDRISDRILIESFIPKTYIHMVTLINRRTEDERLIEVETVSDRFVDVMREISHLKALHGLLNYEVFEIFEGQLPF